MSNPTAKQMSLEVSERVRVIDEIHGPFASAHEAWAVMREELDELWELVRQKEFKRSRIRMRDEALDLAAAAIRFAAQVDDEIHGRKQANLPDRWERRVKLLEARSRAAHDALEGKRDD